VEGLLAGHTMAIAPEGFDQVHQRLTRIAWQPVWPVPVATKEVV